MEKLKRIYEKDEAGFITWAIFLFFLSLQLFNLPLLINVFKEAERSGYFWDIIIYLAGVLSVPIGFIILTWQVFFKK